MNRIEYINQRLASNNFYDSDYIIISSLIYSLTPDEACSYLDLTFEQNHRIRRYVLKKNSSDISKSYTTTHKKLITTLIKKLEEKKFSRKESCAFSLDFLIDSLPTKSSRKIIESFLASKSSRNRNRAFKRLISNWDKKYFELIKQVWYLFHDSDCLKIILNHFPIKFLLENYKNILQHTQPYQASKLFIKIGRTNPELLDELKEIDEISFCYVLAKFGKKVPKNEANTILYNNYKDERIGLLLWSFGQMELWDTIIEYDNTYREKCRQAELEKLDNNWFENKSTTTV